MTGLPGRAAREIRELERRDLSGLWPGAVVDALAGWQRSVRRLKRSTDEEAFQADCPCCGIGPREVLEWALAALRPRARQALYAKIEPVDEVFRRRTGFPWSHGWLG